ncbi:MAG TPA: RidA family protein [Terrimicrobiaceae bacterium]
MTTRKAIYPQYPHALYKEHGYSPAIQSNDLLFVSGMVGARKDGTPEPDLQKQIDLAFGNLLEVLDAAGCTFDDVIDVTMFLVKPEESLSLIVDAMKKVYREPLPNVTAVGVTWLAGFLFEIKVIARIPNTRS